MKIIPLNDRVVVKPIQKNETTKSGIILPETVDKEKPEEGEVVAVGSGKLLDNGQRALMEVKIGDRVLFTKYSPNEIKIDDQELLVINESDIMAIIE
ncbi:co-chaperone GroES [Candidatus Kuenenbacteria bacterium HGW-Kuenenbacteria-1]|uniref:Co-chaperonin GroES n=1 Tax=Candidatus Kuenenbacteria bacterium HGW-Kuenenbacteria-1 TaxID=2013812 RepID=A0A2N1UMN7_9BACT|nr:MAG: co-chaperone GroES [Candidatus Kuenenbacteria bacterium HGW-Kuenenbacteria-1]